MAVSLNMKSLERNIKLLTCTFNGSISAYSIRLWILCSVLKGYLQFVLNIQMGIFIRKKQFSDVGYRNIVHYMILKSMSSVFALHMYLVFELN